MAPHSLEFVRTAVEVLCLTVLGMGVLIYLSMEIHHRRQISSQARRLILTARIPWTPNHDAMRMLWQGSGRRDRGILEEILLDFARSPGIPWRSEVKSLLMELGIFDRWLRELRSGGPAKRMRAATRLGFCPDPRGVRALAAALEGCSRELGLAIAVSLGRLADPGGLPGLVRLVLERSRGVPAMTLAAALAACAGSEPRRLVELLKSNLPEARVIGARALSAVANTSALPEILRAASDPEAEARAGVCRALARIAAGDSVETLCGLARDPVWFVRVRALDALGRLQDPKGEAVALAALGDPNTPVRYRAATALREIRGMNGEVAASVLREGNRRKSESLVSEWDRAGWTWELVSRLTPSDVKAQDDSRRTIRALIEADFTRALLNFVLIYPDSRRRLRLLRLFLDSPSPRVLRGLLAIARQPSCHPRLANKILEAAGAIERAGKGTKLRHV